MYAGIILIYALCAYLCHAFVWKLENSTSNSSPWSKVDLDEQNHPKNIILFLGQSNNSHDCKEGVFNNREPEYFKFSTIITVKSCTNYYKSFCPMKHLAFRSHQQKCDYCEKEMQEAISVLMDLATNVLHLPSGLIAFTNFSDYNLDSDSKLREPQFLYQTGYHEAMSNKTEIQNEPDLKSESDDLIFALIKEINAIQRAFAKRLLKVLGFIEPPFGSSEDQSYFSGVPRLADLVYDMLRKLQRPHNNKGFVLVVNGGYLQEHCGTKEAENLKNAVMTAMTETDPATTLIVVTSSCPENICEQFHDTAKVYAQGPGSKELKNLHFLWNVPRMLSRIWQTGFESKPTSAAESYFPRAKISPVLNYVSLQPKSWNYNKTSESFTQTNESIKNEDDLALTKLLDDVYDQNNMNTTEKQPEHKANIFDDQNIKDDDMDIFLKLNAKTLSAEKGSNDSDKLSFKDTKNKQNVLSAAKYNIISYAENTKKEHKHKPTVTHLPEQHIKGKQNPPNFVSVDTNQTSMHTHEDVVNSTESNTSYDIAQLEKINPEWMQLNTGYISNLTLPSNATTLNQNSSPEKETNRNLLIKKMLLNERNKNILGDGPLPNDRLTEHSLMTENNMSIHENYPSSNIHIYRQALVTLGKLYLKERPSLNTTKEFK